MRVPLRQVLRTLLRDECGQSLIVIVSSMTVLLGMAGFGIDAATWMVKHHDTQVVADSAALAAAQCLANPNQTSTMFVNGSQRTVPECISSADAGNAKKVAVDYAAANGLTISTSDVTVANDVVTVAATTSSPGIFARVFGMTTTTQSAHAGAGWTGGANTCTSPGGAGCDFMFAANSSCQSSSNGISFVDSGGATIQGDIQSNSNLSVVASGNNSFGTATYGPNTNGTCKTSTTASGTYPWSTAPTQATTDYPLPIDYTKDFPACGGSGELACIASGTLAGYPSFCTNAGSSITLIGSSGSGDNMISGNIYCASGSGTKSDPSTWNGSITITTSDNSTVYDYDTFVAEKISFTGSGRDVLSPCGYSLSGYTASNCASGVPAPVTQNYPIFYATGSNSSALRLTVSGYQVFNGDAFAPNGTANLTMSGYQTLVMMIEANNISGTVSGIFKGDGPAAGTLGSPSGGSVTLVQ
ncbi:MAG: pilus assembly protein TadG-related protein [Solirubrobacteraceae bacterium]